MSQRNSTPAVTVGLDFGNRYSRLVALSCDGEVVAEERVATTWDSVQKRFSRLEPDSRRDRS